VTRASTLVFYVGLPAVMVTEISASDFRAVLDPAPAGLLLVATLAWFALSWPLAAALVPQTGSRGAFVQGVFRGNLLLVGIPIISRALGEGAMAEAMVVSAVVMPLYNGLAVVALLPRHEAGGQGRALATARQIATNPIVISVVAGIVLSLLRWRLPDFLHKTGVYLGQMTFPLALIAIGAGIEPSTLRGRLRATVVAGVLKVVALPLSVGAAAWLLGMEPATVAILTFLAATPTAVSSYIMARAMAADADLAGAIVFVTTAASIVTMTVAVLVLRIAGMI